MSKRILSLILAAAMAMQSFGVVALADPAEGETPGAETTETVLPSDGELDTEMDPRGTTFDTGAMSWLVTDWNEVDLQFLTEPGEDLVIPSEVEDPFGEVYSVTGIAGTAFSGTAAVHNLTIPSSVKKIETTDAMFSDLETIKVEGEDSAFFVDGGVLFEKLEDGMRLVLYPSASETIHYSIPAGTTEIASRAFYAAPNLRTVIIPDSVEKIEKEAFTDFANPLDVVFNMDEAPDEIAAEAFSLKDSDENTFYFKNPEILAAIQEASPEFTGESDVEFVTDGLPEGLQILLEEVGAPVLNGAAGEMAEIEEGWYYIKSQAVDGDSYPYALDIEKAVGSNTKDANLDLFKFHATPFEAQLFQIKVKDSEAKTYTIIPYGSQKMALDCAGGNTTAGTNVRQHKNNGTAAQQFNFVTTETEGVYEIAPRDAETCLTAASVKNSANVNLQENTHKETQQWTLVKAENPNDKTDANIKEGWYVIRTAMDDNFALDINGGVKTDKSAAGVDIYKYDPAKELFSQIFYVKKTDTTNNYYTFTPWAARNMVIDCNGGKYTSGTKLIQYKDGGNSALNQRFQILKTDTEGQFEIKTTRASTCISVTDATAANKGTVKLRSYVGGDHQKWIFTESMYNTSKTNLAGGVYVFHTGIDSSGPDDYSTRAMTIGNASMLLRSNIQINKSKGADTQKWLLVPIGDSKYYVINAASNRSIDVKDGKAVHKQNVQLYKPNKSKAQIWTILQEKSGYYRIYTQLLYNGTTSMCLDVNQGKSAENQNVQIGKENYNSMAQEWIIEKSTYSAPSAGMYELATALKEDRTMVLDVPKRKATEGLQYQIYDKKSISSQKFNVTKSGSAYQFQNVKTGKYLGASGSNVVQQAALYNWTLEVADEAKGTFFVKAANGQYMSVSTGKASNGSKITLTTSKGKAQQWYMTKTTFANGWNTVFAKGKESEFYYKNNAPLKSTYIGKAWVDKNGGLWTGWHKPYMNVNGMPYKQGYYYYWDGKNGGATDARPWILNPKTTKWTGTRTRNVRINTSSGHSDRSISGPELSYVLNVDTVQCFIEVYTRFPGTADGFNYGYNTPVFAFKISPGLAPNVTNTGVTKIHAQSNWTELMGPSYGQYTSLINYADGEYIHSVACGQRNTHNVDPGAYNLLGQRASHGCMRACVRNAFWVYCYVPGNTLVDIKAGGHPLTTALIPQPKMYGGTSIDPTDPLYTGNYSYTDNGKYYGSYYF